MATIYGLSESDVKLVRELLAFWKTRIKNTSGRANNEMDLKEQAAPEVYVAKTGEAGIGAFEGASGTGTGTGTANAVPSAACVIYQLHPTSEYLLSKVITRTIYNLSSSAIDGNTYIIVARDKFGVWWALGVGATGSADVTTGTGTGTGTVTPCEGTFFTDERTWQEIDCIEGVLYRTTFTQEVTWEYIDGCVSVDEGPIEEGESEEIGCCDCDDDGTGTGEDETVLVPCCEDVEVPAVLRVRISGTTCVGAGTYSIYIVPSSIGTSLILWTDITGGTYCAEIPPSATTDFLVLRCEDGDWGFLVADALIPAVIDTVQCSPFLMTGTLPSSVGGCLCTDATFEIYDPAFPP